MILAGDLGATTTRLGLFDAAGPRPSARDVREYRTHDHDGLGTLIDRFLDELHVDGAAVGAATIGVAGPVVDGRADLQNVPWTVDARDLAARLPGAAVSLINDVEAVAWAVPVLSAGEVVPLTAIVPPARGNVTVVTIGTGFGSSLLHDIDGDLVPSPCETGHADYPPRTDREIELLFHLRARHGRVDVERVASGIGLALVSEFTHGGRCHRARPDADLAAHVVTEGLAESCASCSEALDLVVASIAAMAGNLALIHVAARGVFIGGGIAPRILPRLRRLEFLRIFRAKPPLASFLDAVPVSVITNAHAGILGAAVHGCRTIARR